MEDREPVVVNTNGGGSGGWAVAVIILIAVIAAGFFFFGRGLFEGGHVNVDVKLPKAEAPAN